MARTTLAKTVLLGSYPVLPLTANSADITFTATTGLSGTNGNQVAFDTANTLLILAWNTHATDAHTITFTSEADQYNRTGDISAYSIGATEIAMFQFRREGWRQSDGYLYLETSNAAIKVAAVALA